ncbi:MAG: TonB family protein [Deltaproteobacteria bacterium]|nr:TonB family protein [Deltaproteobacteria bacterium]
MRRTIGLLALLGSAPAWAEEAQRTGSPYFFVGNAGDAAAMPLESTHADISVAGTIARVHVRQSYRNKGGSPIEAVYVFPASTRAAIFGLSMKIGDRKIVAEIKKRAEAAKLYEDAKEAGKSATLLEQDRPNVFRMNVANILPGDLIEVDLDYVEHLIRTEGEYELVYPTVVGPRFTGESASPPPSAAAPYLREGAKSNIEASISVKIAAGTPVHSVRSPSHDVAVRSETKSSVRVDLSHSSNKDFILRYRLDDDQISSGVLLFPGEKENFFLATIEPPKRVEARQISPREYVFVVDVSGSMSGFPLDTAKMALRTLFSKLRPIDRFNVVQFSGGALVMAEQSVRASPANLRKAEEIVSGLRGGGGTEVLGALRRTLAMPRAKGYATAIVVITDGYVTVEKEAFELVRKSLGEASLFALGIGTSVNRELIETLARAGLGEPQVAVDAAEAEAAANAVIRAIESPVLTDLSVRFDGFGAYDVEPPSIPDLYASRPVVLFGKYKGQPTGSIKLAGAAADGPFSATIDAGSATPNDDLVALRYLWARHRIRTLSDLESLGEAGTAESITSLGLEYGLMSAYTSFVAVDSQIRNTTGRVTKVEQPLALPEGVSELAVSNAVRAPFGGVAGFGTRGMGAGGGGAGYGRVGGIGSIKKSQERGAASSGFAGGASPPAAAPAAAPGPAPEPSQPAVVKSGEVVVSGSLAKDEIGRVIRRSFGRVRSAYEKTLQKNPAAAGKIVVSFTINGDGSVSDVKVVSSTVGDPDLEAELTKIFLSLKFPQPVGGGSVKVSYPVAFAPAG